MRIIAAAGAERAEPEPSDGHSDSTYFLELAYSYKRDGEHHKAIRLLQGILESDPMCAAGYALLAEVLTDEGRLPEALACWERLAELDPRDERARTRINAMRSQATSRTLNAAAEERADPAVVQLPFPSATRQADTSTGRLLRAGESKPAPEWPPLRAVRDEHGSTSPAEAPQSPAVAETHAPSVDTVAPTPTAAQVAIPAPPAAAQPATPPAPAAAGPASAPAPQSGAPTAPRAAAAPDSLTVALADLLVGMLEFRDPYFRGSSSQTRLLAGAIARRLGLPEEDARNIELGAVLRDLGQQPLKALISQVGSGLSDDAKRHVEQHVDTAVELLSGLDLPAAVMDAIRYHHERWDGSGYPDALSGETIPISARIVAVADTFGAMIAARPHRLPQRVSSALDDMKKWAGSRYDPAVVEALIHVVEDSGWAGPGFGLRQHLIIADAREARATTAAMRLCAQGYLAEAAYSAESAMKRVQRSRVTRPAGFVISAELPGGEALELLRQLRGSPRTTSIPVVVTDTTAEQRVAFLRAGADACLPARSSFDELNATFEALLRRTWGQDPTHVPGTTTENIWAGLQGDLEEFPLSWLLQVLHYDGRSAGVFIVGKDDEGAIYLDRGNPRFAQTRTLTGEAAFREMMRWSAGSFTVDADARVDHHTISTPLMNLLLEQAVVDDHSAFAGAQNRTTR